MVILKPAFDAEGHRLSWALKLSQNSYTYFAIVIEKYKKRIKGNGTRLSP
jgi:hypothetical protein